MKAAAAVVASSYKFYDPLDEVTTGCAGAESANTVTRSLEN